jgi:hypothetical protein
MDAAGALGPLSACAPPPLRLSRLLGLRGSGSNNMDRPNISESSFAMNDWVVATIGRTCPLNTCVRTGMAEIHYITRASAKPGYESVPHLDSAMRSVTHWLEEQCLIQWSKLLVAKLAIGLQARDMRGSQPWHIGNQVIPSHEANTISMG